MSFEYQGFSTLGVNLNRQKYGPLDISNVFNSQADLNYYLSKGAITENVSDYWKAIVPYPYAGQVVALVKEDRTVNVFVLKEKEDGTFEVSNVGAEVDLTAYSTTEEMNQAIEDAVNSIDLSAYATTQYVDEAIANISIPEDTDTKTNIVSGDDYIVVNGELTTNTENTFTVSINVDTLKSLIGAESTAAMEFKGAVDYLPLVTNKGDVYKVSAIFEVPANKDAEGIGFTPRVGDSIVCDGEDKWYLIPSGDDIEDTWRPVEGVNSAATLVFAAGDLLEVSVDPSGVITYNHAKVNAPVIETDESGSRIYITNISTDEYGHLTGYTTALETVVDTNDKYEAGNGIEIGEANENSVHNVAIKIAANEKYLVVNEDGLATNFDLDIYATKESVAKDKEELTDKIDGKVSKVIYQVEQEDGTTKQVEGTLLSPIDREKLDKLAFDENGDVGVSGSIDVGQVQGLTTWFTANYPTIIKNLTEENLSQDVVDKINYISDVDASVFTVTEGKLLFNGIAMDKVVGLNDLNTKVDNLESSLNNYVTIAQFNQTVGNLDNLLSANKTLAQDIESIYERLTWQELQ